ncbi:MAG: hypothetical protein PHT40_01180 [Patescibacteria group bacterium]|nr:hypothetical protein [Patescibacteria group bacterium]
MKTPSMEKPKSVEAGVEKEAKKETWESALDSWVEQKIQKELDRVVREKYKGKNESVVASMKKEWPNRVEAEDRLKAKLKTVLPRAFHNFAVHGTPMVNGEGKRIISKYTDLDAKTCLGLIQLVEKDLPIKAKNKINSERISHVDFSDRPAATVLLDVGQYDGVALLKEVDEGLETIDLAEKEKILQKKRHDFFLKLGLIIDHHPESETPSATGMLFKILDKLAMFDGQKEISREDKAKLKKMIEFVNVVDSNGFQAVGAPDHFQKSDRTLLGLNRFLNFNALWDYFKNTSGNFTRELGDGELQRLGLIYKDKNGKIINRQEQQRKVIDSSREKIQELEKGGFVIETKFGKVIIDIDSKLGGGTFAAQSIGAGYLKWDSKTDTLFLFIDKELPEDLFDYGTRVRKSLWVMSAGSGKTKLGLKGVIERLGGQVAPGSKLEEYLNQNQ